MPVDVSRLMVECQIALRLTQKEMGALVGKDRRTIQRWQSTGTHLLPSDAEKLAVALRASHPELADRVMMAAAAWGVGTSAPASPAAVGDILRAAAVAGGTSPRTTRAVVAAAFARAAQLGVGVGAVLAGLDEKK